MKKILVVEDDLQIGESIRVLLSNNGYSVEHISKSEEVINVFQSFQPDIVLLDVDLGGKYDGYTLCGMIREHSTVPIIFLTAKADVIDEVQAFNLGGNDFINKPYHPSILLARITNQLKKNEQTQESDTLSHNGVTLIKNAYKLEANGKQIELSKNEYKLVHYLMQRPNEVISREEIIDYLWDNDVYIDDNALSVNMTRVRNKLEEIGVKDFIQTKRGVGYQI